MYKVQDSNSALFVTTLITQLYVRADILLTRENTSITVLFHKEERFGPVRLVLHLPLFIEVSVPNKTNMSGHAYVS